MRAVEVPEIHPRPSPSRQRLERQRCGDRVRDAAGIPGFMRADRVRSCALAGGVINDGHLFRGIMPRRIVYPAIAVDNRMRNVNG